MNNLHETPQYEWPEKPREFIVVNDGDTYPTYAILDGVLTITDSAGKAYKIPWNGIDRIDGVKVLCPQDAVAQVTTLTPTANLPQTYPDQATLPLHITLKWKELGTGIKMQKTYSITPSTSITWTATTLNDAMRTAINADDDAIVTATGTTTIVLTADDAGQGFTVDANSTFFAVVHTVKNKIQFGAGSSFAAIGFTEDDGIQDDDDTDYCIVEIPYATYAIGDEPTNNSYSQNATLDLRKLWIVVETGGAAEDAVLGTTIGQSGKLCYILAGSDTASKYTGVIHQGCPCS